MPTHKIPSSLPAIDTIEKITAWWTALQTCYSLQRDIATARAWLFDRAQHPLTDADASVLEIPTADAPYYRTTASRMGLWVVHLRMALEHRYPRLAEPAYCPALMPAYVYSSLARAIRWDWGEGLRHLVMKHTNVLIDKEGKPDPSFPSMTFGPTIRVEIDRVRWEGSADQFDGLPVPADATRPVLTHRLWATPGMVVQGQEETCILIIAPTALDRQGHTQRTAVSREDYEAACAEAWAHFHELALEQGNEEAALLRDALVKARHPRPGADKSYFAMVALYNNWCEREKPAQIGRGLTAQGRSKRYDKRLLAQAIAWLEPEQLEVDIFGNTK